MLSPPPAQPIENGSASRRRLHGAVATQLGGTGVVENLDMPSILPQTEWSK
jgi:hypothetical protein